MRQSPPRFLAAWTAQATWVSLCLAPVIAVNAVPAAAFAEVASPLVKVTDDLGLALYAGGLVLEIVADTQKDRWVSEKRAKAHDEQFMTRGLWSWRYVCLLYLYAASPISLSLSLSLL